MCATMLLLLIIVNLNCFVEHLRTDGSLRFSPTHPIFSPKLLRAFVTLLNSLPKRGNRIFFSVPQIKETTFLFLKQLS